MNETEAGMRNEKLTTGQRRFVILGTQRTGTILLMGLLDSHPEIACIGELFQHRADYVQHSVPRYRLYVASSPKNRHSGSCGEKVNHTELSGQCVRDPRYSGRGIQADARPGQTIPDGIGLPEGA